MKKLFTHVALQVAFAGLVASGHAATYYISSTTGDDSRSMLEARNAATPWRSIEKLNSFFGNLNPGDSVLLKRSDVFYGTIIPSRQGMVAAPIYFGAYGHGVKPLISGYSPLTAWKAVGNGIYESNCSNGGGSTLTINNVQQAIGRYPNKGYLTYRSHEGNSSISGDPLAANWTGAEVVIRKTRWVIDRSTITNQSGGTINYASTSKVEPTNGFGYFIQNDIKTLDRFGEWYYDPKRQVMSVYFGNEDPNNYIIRTSVVTSLVNIRRLGYLTFENLTFKGAAGNAINIIQGRSITLKNCSIDQSGAEAVFANYSPLVSVINCEINHSLSGAIDLDAGCVSAVLSGNVIKNTGLIPGMGKSGTGTYEAITSFGDDAKIEKNRIDSTGYDGIYFGGNNAIAQNNYITYFCLTKDDGAGIYLGDWSKTINKKVTGNIVMHGIGNSEGATYTSSLQAEGIYIDDNTSSVVIEGNTVSACANNGIKIHNARDIEIADNFVYDNGVQLRLEQDHYIQTSGYIRNAKIHNNAFVSANTQHTAKFSTQQDDISEFGTLDNNVYCCGNVQRAPITASTVKSGRGVNDQFNIAAWKQAYGKDKSSAEVPSNDILFEVNTSNSAKVIQLKKPYADVHNKMYTDKVVVNPYSSVLLVAANVKPAGVAHRFAE